MTQIGDSILEKMKAQKGKKFTGSPSPFTMWLDPVILEVEEGALSFEYQVRHDMTNPIKTLHGGAIAGMMDDTIGAAVFTLGLKEFFTTVNLTVDYFSPVVEGDIIIASAKVVKKGRQIVHVICDLKMKNGDKLLAHATSNLIKLERRLNSISPLAE
ncbi:MAG: hypothetical protein A2W85_05875 [Bacteroidetes bacterium GWF2_41_31]|nr:MAG: hypothetical protein A2W85_05875 [Bacteroidetes bacterium GWF2_41_31]OFZ03216.1 MAG: hypothetical protein A2338_09705 [Bacteroidetes bacterium RIFOXYB12_FULL_41_6]